MIFMFLNLNHKRHKRTYKDCLNQTPMYLPDASGCLFMLVFSLKLQHNIGHYYASQTIRKHCPMLQPLAFNYLFILTSLPICINPVSVSERVMKYKPSSRCRISTSIPPATKLMLKSVISLPLASNISSLPGSPLL